MIKTYQNINNNVTVFGASISRVSAQVNVENSGVDAYVKDNKFSEYNFFIKRYNESCNIVDNIDLETIPVPKLLCTLRGSVHFAFSFSYLSFYFISNLYFINILPYCATYYNF